MFCGRWGSCVPAPRRCETFVGASREWHSLAVDEEENKLFEHTNSQINKKNSAFVLENHEGCFKCVRIFGVKGSEKEPKVKFLAELRAVLLCHSQLLQISGDC